MSFNPIVRRRYRRLAATLLAVSLCLSAPALAQSAATDPQTTPAASAPAKPSSAQVVPSQPTSASPAAVALQLPRDLSPWGMFLNADIVVKTVMVGLALASVLTWTIWLAKAIELAVARRRLRFTLRVLDKAQLFAGALVQLAVASHDAQALARAAEAELRLSADSMAPEGVKERIASRLARIEAAASRQMIRGTGLLATVGAVAPFVGLFGTVWGIMNSFIGISRLHTTNLAVVAPGIAEALLATALGLVAAIPAVVMYNMLTRWIGGYRALLGDAGAEILRLVSRDLDRGVLPRQRSAAAE